MQWNIPRMSSETRIHISRLEIRHARNCHAPRHVTNTRQAGANGEDYPARAHKSQMITHLAGRTSSAWHSPAKRPERGWPSRRSTSRTATGASWGRRGGWLASSFPRDGVAATLAMTCQGSQSPGVSRAPNDRKTAHAGTGRNLPGNTVYYHRRTALRVRPGARPTTPATLHCDAREWTRYLSSVYRGKREGARCFLSDTHCAGSSCAGAAAVTCGATFPFVAVVASTVVHRRPAARMFSRGRWTASQRPSGTFRRGRGDADARRTKGGKGESRDGHPRSRAFERPRASDVRINNRYVPYYATSRRTRAHRWTPSAPAAGRRRTDVATDDAPHQAPPSPPSADAARRRRARLTHTFLSPSFGDVSADAWWLRVRLSIRVRLLCTHVDTAVKLHRGRTRKEQRERWGRRWIFWKGTHGRAIEGRDLGEEREDWHRASADFQPHYFRGAITPLSSTSSSSSM